MQLISVFLVGGLITYFFKLQTEYREKNKLEEQREFKKSLEIFKSDLLSEQWERNKSLEDFRQIRKEIAETGRNMLVFQHKMIFFCWHAKYSPHIIDDTFISRYDKEMEQAFPSMLGGMAEIASLDDNAYNEINKIQRILINQEADLARLWIRFQKNKGNELERAKVIEEVGNYFEMPSKEEQSNQISKKIGRILSMTRDKYSFLIEGNNLKENKI